MERLMVGVAVGTGLGTEALAVAINSTGHVRLTGAKRASTGGSDKSHHIKLTC